AETARQTLDMVAGMGVLMADYKSRMRAHVSVKYSQDLLNNLFRHPYTRIEFVQADLEVTRQTAARYLEHLVTAGFVKKHQQGRYNYYVNTPLVALLMRASEQG
ncbi:MAG: Fic family protein, partial [Pseudomonadota bacterium]|nr:Fic family protein [Pseudomonadota bacterium]